MSTTDIKGLTYVTEVISKEIEEELLQNIKQNKWENPLSRKTQQYGYEYVYTRPPVIIKPTKAIPNWLYGIKEEVHPEANQVIINHYFPGQGIAPHIDSRQFGGKIVSVTLGHGCYMNFIQKDGTESSLYLKPRSCLTLEDEARWDVKHSIDKRMYDIVEGKRVPRGERISLTFRSYKP